MKNYYKNYLIQDLLSLNQPRYIIVLRTVSNQFGENEDQYYVILKRKWFIFYYYEQYLRHDQSLYRFENFDEAEQYLSTIHPAKKSNVVDKIIKEYL